MNHFYTKNKEKEKKKNGNTTNVQDGPKIGSHFVVMYINYFFKPYITLIFIDHYNEAQ